MLERLRPGVTAAGAETGLRTTIEDLSRSEPATFPEQNKVGLMTFLETVPGGIRRELYLPLASVGLLPP